MVGGSGGNDTLNLGSWVPKQRAHSERGQIDGAFGRGDIDQEFFFERFENLTGGMLKNDVFVMDGGSIAGTVDGGSGNNTLDYSGISGPVEVNRATTSATSVGQFSNVDLVRGSTSSSDTLIGAHANATWNVTGTDAGNIDGSLEFQSFENLTGGDANDDFVVAAGGSISGKLLGSTSLGAGDTDTLDLSAKTSALSVDVQSENQGVVSGGASVEFDRVESLIGGSANDHFTIAPLAGLTGTIDGGLGDEDHLDYSIWLTSVTVDLDAGNNHIGNVAGIEHLTGGSADDALTGNASANRIIGLGGADTIDGKGGNNVLIGDSATITASSISTNTSSDDGNDDIDAGDGNNIILPGSGDDIVDGRADGNNVVAGDQAIVTLSGAVAVDLQSGTGIGGGDDTITLGGGNNLVIGGEGADTITVGTLGTTGSNAILGDRGIIDRIGNETSSVTSENTIGADSDTITTGGGADAIIGGGMDDIIDAGNGNNYVLGDDGTITFTANLPTASVLNPTNFDGNDSITTGSGRDFVFTGDGDNTVQSGDGIDDVLGGSGIDNIDGQGGNDWIVGLLGDDEI